MAKLNVQTPDGKTLTIDVGTADPSQYPTIVDDVMKDYIGKQNLASMNNQGPLDELKSFIPTSKEDLKDFADTTAAVGKTAAQGLGGIAALVSPLGNALAGVPQPETDTTQLAAAIAKGTEKFPGEDTIAGLLDPKYMAAGEIAAPIFNRVAVSALDFTGEMLAKLADFLGTTPEALSNLVRKYPGLKSVLDKVTNGLLEKVDEISAHLENAAREAPGNFQPGKSVPTADELRDAVNEAKQLLKTNPTLFTSKLRSYLEMSPKAGDFKEYYGILRAFVEIISKPSSWSNYGLGGAAGLTWIAHLLGALGGPISTAFIALIDALTIASTNPVAQRAIQTGLGKAIQTIVPAVTPAVEAAPSIANAIRGAISDTKENQ